MKIEMTLKMPTMPNFVILKDPNDRDDVAFEAKIAVEKLNDDQVDRFIEHWAEAFRAHVAERRARK